MQKIIRNLGIALALCCMVLGQFQPVYAMDDGAYLIGSSASYVNPLTGTTEDGGSNIALGESMVGSIVESSSLVEQSNGALYVTVGLGLASNVSNVRFQLMNADGSKRSVSGTITGSSTANGDTVNHYRIQVDSLTQYISPILFVTPMGRDVQFFIQLNTGSISAGTGIYNSLMVASAPVEKEQTKTETTQPEQPAKDSEMNTDTTNKETSDDVKKEDSNTDKAEKEETKAEQTVGDKTITKETLFQNVTGLSYHSLENKTSQVWLYAGVAAVVIVAGAGGIWYVKKRKK